MQQLRRKVNGYIYFPDQRIGSGCEGEVYRGLLQRTGEPVAIKVIPRLDSHPENQLLAQNEIHSLQLMKGQPHVLQLRHAIQTHHNFYIVTELCPQGTLADYIKQHRPLSESAAIGLIQQVITGYSAITAAGLVHRDLKPTNILVDEKGELKIADLGFAVPVEKCTEGLKENVGSPLYMPLEALVRNKYGFESDIWAIGVILLEMLLGKNPWKAKTQTELIQQLSHTTLAQKMPNVSIRTRMFLEAALQQQPTQRITLSQLTSYKFTEQEHKEEVVAKLREAILQNANLKGKSADKIKQQYNRDKSKGKSEALHRSPAGLPEKQAGNGHNQQANSNQHIAYYLEKHEERGQRDSSQNSKSNEDDCSVGKFIDKSSNFTPASPVKTKPVNMCKPNTRHKDCLQMGRKVQQQFQQEKRREKDGLSGSQMSIGKWVCLQQVAERQIMLQVQSQVNYFRFLFKLLRKVHESVKTTDSHISTFKGALLAYLLNSIRQIGELKYVRGLKVTQLAAFRLTNSYNNIQKVLNSYKDRYMRETDKWGLEQREVDRDELERLLAYLMKVLFQNVRKAAHDEVELNRKKSLVLILEDSVQLRLLLSLEREHNWLSFSLKSNTKQLAQRTPPQKIDLTYWREVERKIAALPSH